MRTRGGFMAKCDCGVTEEFATEKQRHQWVLKRHVGHTYWTWRKLFKGARP